MKKPKDKTAKKDDGLEFSKYKQTRDGLSVATESAKTLIDSSAKLAKLKKLAKQSGGISFGIHRSNTHVAKAGWIEFEGREKIYMRSTWERNFSRYLEWLRKNNNIKNWQFEPKRFDFPVKRGNNSYLPDFKITENDDTVTFYEVKGYFDQASRVKMKRFLKFYPELKLVIIDKNAYKDIEKQCKNLIPNWE